MYCTLFFTTLSNLSIYLFIYFFIYLYLIEHPHEGGFSDSICVILLVPNFVDFQRGRKTRVPGEKPSKHRRDQLREVSQSHETLIRHGFSGDKHNVLTDCATCAPLYVSDNFTQLSRGYSCFVL